MPGGTLLVQQSQPICFPRQGNNFVAAGLTMGKQLVQTFHQRMGPLALQAVLLPAQNHIPTPPVKLIARQTYQPRFQISQGSGERLCRQTSHHHIHLLFLDPNTNPG